MLGQFDGAAGLAASVESSLVAPPRQWHATSWPWMPLRRSLFSKRIMRVSTCVRTAVKHASGRDRVDLRGADDGRGGGVEHATARCSARCSRSCCTACCRWRSCCTCCGTPARRREARRRPRPQRRPSSQIAAAMRPVTRSRRNEKNRDGSLDGAPAAAADRVDARRPAGGRAPAPAGRPASPALPARARELARCGSGRCVGTRASSAERLEHVGADLERASARCTAPSQAAARRARSAAASHSAATRRLEHAARPGRASRHAPRRRRAPSGAANSTGRQSATCTVQAMPGSVVTLASAAWIGAPGAARHASAARRASPCTWRSQTGVAPIASASSGAGSRATASARRRRRSRRFMLSNGAALKPPARVVINAPTPGRVPVGPQPVGRSAHVASGQRRRLRLRERVEAHAGLEARASPSARGRCGTRSAAR